MTQITDRSDALAFVLAGNARFSLKSRVTGKHYTFRVKQSRKNARIHNVQVIRNEGPPLSIGYIMDKTNFSLGKYADVGLSAPTFNAFAWLWYKALAHDQHWTQCEFYHLGRCAKCGRTLTDPQSILTGVGPICRGKL